MLMSKFVGLFEINNFFSQTPPFILGPRELCQSGIQSDNFIESCHKMITRKN